MTGIGYKRTIGGRARNVRFTPESRRQELDLHFEIVWQFNSERDHENSGITLTLPLPPRQPAGT
jgi:hypothetical protein